MCGRKCHPENRTGLTHGMTFFETMIGRFIRSYGTGTGYKKNNQQNIKN